MKQTACLLLILVVACCVTASAQDVSKPASHVQTPAIVAAQTHQSHPAPPFHRWSFNASAGPAFPAGSFAHTTGQDPQCGTVHTGSLYEFSATYRLNHSWGITLLANHQHHKGEANPLIFPDPSIPDFVVPGPLTSQTDYAAVTPQYWSMTRLLAGGVYTFPLNKKKSLALLFRALAGIQKTHVSQYQYSLTYLGETATSSFPARNLAWAFSYQADAGLQWKLYRRWSLLVFAGYSGSRPSYNQDITELLRIDNRTGPNMSQVFKKIDFPTGSILVRTGVGFDL